MSCQENTSDSLWKALLVEFLGTFTLVFVGTSAVALTMAQGGSILTSALAFGLALLALIYVWGSYSGAHFNPAVSFGFAVAGQMNWGLMFGYWVAQFLGAIAAAGLIAYFFGTANGGGASIGTLTNSNAWAAVLLEAILTFFLVIAYLFVYRNPMHALMSGLIIGLTLAFCTISGLYLTGGSTNPARSFGSAIFTNNLGSYWIYIVGPLLGALVAALVYKLFTVDMSCCYKLDDCGKRLVDDCGNCLKTCKRQVYDKCGKPVMDCGKAVMEEYTCVERNYGYKQETPLHKMGEWLNKHGLDPLSLKPCAPCGDVTTITETLTKKIESTPSTIVPAMTQPVMAPPVMAPQGFTRQTLYATR